MNLNLGCGTNKLDDYINVDIDPQYEPEVVWDMRQTPWPWEDDTFDTIRAWHILEHIGPEYLDVMREIHRVGKAGAMVDVNVPYFMSEGAWRDPTHVRAFSLESFLYFDSRWPDYGADYGIRGLFRQEWARLVKGSVVAELQVVK